ncbi:hypothetical protein NT05HA_1391 [Aggregatibacter aphrophilus NJ8700]|nr:hypothetical protein NT05HA_1391 [Aggregatibacter aphrophilus NJ8700]
MKLILKNDYSVIIARKLSNLLPNINHLKSVLIKVRSEILSFFYKN